MYVCTMSHLCATVRFESTQANHSEFRLSRLSQKRLAPVDSVAAVQAEVITKV